MSDSVSGLNSLYTNTYTSSTNSTASSIQDTLSNTDLSSASDDKLLSVCKDFEQYFVEQMVKSMVKMADVSGNSDTDSSYASLFGLSSGDDSSSDSSDSGMSTMASYYGDKMVSIMSEALCKSNGGKGIGLAQTLYQQMKKNYNIPETTAAATSTVTKPATDATKDAVAGATKTTDTGNVVQASSVSV